MTQRQAYHYLNDKEAIFKIMGEIVRYLTSAEHKNAHDTDVVMSEVTCQITSLIIVYSTLFFQYR